MHTDVIFVFVITLENLQLEYSRRGKLNMYSSD